MSVPSVPPRRILARGLRVHPIGIGAWALGGPDHNLGLPMGWSTADDTASRAGLETAYELGANLIDTADVYGHGHSERIIGAFAATVPRDSLVLSSKVGYFRGTARHPYLPGTMRRQLETTLENLRTDHLDIYFLHNADFGEGDQHLDGAVEQMRDFQRQGLITAVGMRGPHRYATERIRVSKARRTDKYARFTYLAQRIRPDYLAARFNALTPPPADGLPDIFTLASSFNASVLINKPLAQGLLTGKYDPARPPAFGAGDHRTRKSWYTPAALKIIDDGLAPLRARFGTTTADLTRVALQYCLQRSENAAVLAGFTRPEQITESLRAIENPLTYDELAFVGQAMTSLQRRLDQHSEVFLDEKKDA